MISLAQFKTAETNITGSTGLYSCTDSFTVGALLTLAPENEQCKNAQDHWLEIQASRSLPCIIFQHSLPANSVNPHRSLHL